MADSVAGVEDMGNLLDKTDEAAHLELGADLLAVEFSFDGQTAMPQFSGDFMRNGETPSQRSAGVAGTEGSGDAAVAVE